MKPQSIEEIEKELGSWEKEMSFPYHGLRTKLERSTSNMELYFPNPDNEVLLLARPKGLQLVSMNDFSTRKDFALPYNHISAIEFLPSYSTEKKPSLNFLYMAASAALFGMIGSLFDDTRAYIAIWAVMGILFGTLLSIYINKRYRHNLMITLMEENKPASILLSVRKSKKKEMKVFFNRFCSDKFIG